MKTKKFVEGLIILGRFKMIYEEITCFDIKVQHLGSSYVTS